LNRQRSYVPGVLIQVGHDVNVTPVCWYPVQDALGVAGHAGQTLEGGGVVGGGVGVGGAVVGGAVVGTTVGVGDGVAPNSCRMRVWSAIQSVARRRWSPVELAARSLQLASVSRAACIWVLTLAPAEPETRNAPASRAKAPKEIRIVRVLRFIISPGRRGVVGHAEATASDVTSLSNSHPSAARSWCAETRRIPPERGTEMPGSRERDTMISVAPSAIGG
jgi:hypothetical protein